MQSHLATYLRLSWAIPYLLQLRAAVLALLLRFVVLDVFGTFAYSVSDAIVDRQRALVLADQISCLRIWYTGRAVAELPFPGTPHLDWLAAQRQDGTVMAEGSQGCRAWSSQIDTDRGGLIVAILSSSGMSQVTQILNAIEAGDQRAAGQLLPLVYDELRKLAKSRLVSEKPGQTLQATDLVHEAYRRLVEVVDGESPRWNSTGHFFAAAAEAMRRILIDRARARTAQKRGGELQRVELDEIDHPAARRPEKLLELDEALTKLEQQDMQKAQLIKLRFFAGLTTHQAAAALGISPATADRHWAFARAWLKTEMES